MTTSTRIEAFDIGEAVCLRINQGESPALNWEQVKEVVEHPTTGKSRSDLVEVIAYLGAQLVGARTSIDRDAALAMAQIERIVRDHQTRKASA